MLFHGVQYLYLRSSLEKYLSQYGNLDSFIYLSQLALTTVTHRTLQVGLVSTIAILNNLTFRYKIPLSIQIVLRSAGK
jgi:hypothetical protein